MSLHRIHRVQKLAVSLHESWDFFSDPANLARITPPGLRFRVTCPEPSPMHAGQILTYTVRTLPGLTMRWVTEITHVRAPGFFVDEQRLGPYRFWHHQHAFRSVPGGTEMTDLVHYALPLWPLGEAAAGFVAARLDWIFEYRRQALEGIFGTP